MLIFYGKGVTTLREGRIGNVTCPECQTDTTMLYKVFGRYWHFYWIPMFPLTRKTIAECMNCKMSYNADDFRENIQKRFRSEKELRPARIPIWYFTGTAIVAAFVGWLFYDIHLEDQNTEAYLASPKINDIYRVKADEKNYSAYKVAEVNKDSLYLLANDLMVDQKDGIDKINTPEHYKELYAFSRKDLRKMYRTEEIYQIDRP